MCDIEYYPRALGFLFTSLLSYSIISIIVRPRAMFYTTILKDPLK